MALGSMLVVPMTDKAAWVAAAPSKTIQRLAELPSHSKVPYTPTIASGRVLSVQEVTLARLTGAPAPIGPTAVGVTTRNARCYCMPYNPHHSHPEVLDDPLGLWGQ